MKFSFTEPTDHDGTNKIDESQFKQVWIQFLFLSAKHWTCTQPDSFFFKLITKLSA